MAIKITANTEKLTRADLGGGSTWTVAFWYRAPSSFTSATYLARLGSRVIEHPDNTSGVKLVGFTATNVFSLSAGAWGYIAYVQTGNNLALYGWDDTSTTTPTTIIPSTYSPTSLTTFNIGGRAGYSFSQVNAEYLHVRAWEGTALTTGELDLERKSATALKAGVTQSSPLVDSFTAATGLDLTPSGTAYSWTTESPTMLAGGTSVAPLAMGSFMRMRNG